ncbi:hypothetical protein DY023_05455 [Microbacterium bovistercoris]|uniref:Uncharacterized protein n=1 Tax=Microbacterium bovistercoris TaxID=2293570 RepID=A0A371NVC1_9MICO|nr:hypothetical protein [Microbacterium bovistercoris]REJ06554.1 hypothetical protein DY023_05455 [Microbacterium bovistercoris]
MEWDHLFDDLEGQLASEWEAERAALDAESERLRISKLTLHDRLRALCGQASVVVLDLGDEHRLHATMRTIGADWIAVTIRNDPRPLIVPIAAIAGVGTDHGSLLGSLAETAELSPLRARMDLGFVLRDLARRRTTVALAVRDGGLQHGTIDRAGADHLDIALHDAGEPRRTSTVRGFRVVPFSSLRWIRAEQPGARLP